MQTVWSKKLDAREGKGFNFEKKWGEKSVLFFPLSWLSMDSDFAQFIAGCSKDCRDEDAEISGLAGGKLKGLLSHLVDEKKTRLCRFACHL